MFLRCLWRGIFALSVNLVLASASQAQMADSKIAFCSTRDGNPEVYVMNPDGTNLINLTKHPADDRPSSWSPDGTKIAFSSNRDGAWSIYVMNADGTNPTRLTHDPAYNVGATWSPDGRRLAFGSHSGVLLPLKNTRCS
ncbi:MAG: hypothetical protein A3F84_17995 [Candidatus Handelsmanbacteria bacterium RIFCSPLOWO2_12_FULL_64_10]|uniref:Dipeptidylpeptidase IV N-terminal domain-containing protein n=1 Tax=Handelsmanbacteria sp. (strain RIFCSPLOWO2_12_FULL_64_10) TaxID=1817868 RepID=A0A1F6CSV0_HANXR|nr:MAG: hypothetical protein A3F84_17995 [Candidatus Handelsmanbacteria bacterium RIFCSPLOWO2_12_FULL_64_10]